MIEPPCARCGREAPPQESDHFGEWEALDDGDAVVCPGCITPAEQQAIDEEMMTLGDTTPLEDPSDPRSESALTKPLRIDAARALWRHK